MEEKTLADYGIDESKFNMRQIQALRLGLYSGVDISIYADPKYDGRQMAQLRLGLEVGVDVSVYAGQLPTT